MESKTHWVFDYIKKDTKHMISAKTPAVLADNKNKKPDYKRAKSYQTDKGVLVNRESFSDQDISQGGSHKTDLMKEKTAIKRTSLLYQNQSGKTDQNKFGETIQEEFNKIEKELDEIIQLSIDIKGTKDSAYIDDIMAMVLEKINQSILDRTKEIKALFTRYNDKI